MKLIHLSDLHIGKRLGEASMLEEQAYILDQILDIIDAQQPQAVLICGDVYDKSVPAAEAVTLFDDFLCRLSQRSTQVMIISGNHDSPERLAFGSRLMTASGIHISPVYDGNAKSVTLEDEHGQVVFWLLPFLKPTHIRRYYPEEKVESYTDAVAAAIGHMALDTEKRNVLLTHQFVTGAAAAGSEELSVGGSDNVDASVFECFDYVALGHIHGQQNIGSNRIRYCGTPLKYAFSEEHHHKSVTLAELGEKGELRLQLIPLTPLHDLRSIRGSFAQLTDPAFYEHTARNDHLHVILTDEEDVPEAAGRLRDYYPNMRKLSYDNTRTRTENVIGLAQDVQTKTPLELFEELYALQNGQPMSQEQRQYVKALLQTLREVQP